MQLTTAEYDALIARFCASSVQPQPVSYGSEPMHHPEKETIESESISGASAIVETRHTGSYDIVTDYEYHLVQEAGEWRIASLLYVAEDGKFECL